MLGEVADDRRRWLNAFNAQILGDDITELSGPTDANDVSQQHQDFLIGRTEHNNVERLSRAES